MKLFGRVVVAASMVLCIACGDDVETGNHPSDGGVDAPVNMDDAKAPSDLAVRPVDAELVHSQGGGLENPDILLQPPKGSLPCDLIPPTLKL